MKRREFIALLGGAAAAWSLRAGAAGGGCSQIGVLWPGDAPPVSPRMESFRQGLRALGFVDGHAIELRLFDVLGNSVDMIERRSCGCIAYGDVG
jgi:putative ABC transport system substrate-binding protein